MRLSRRGLLCCLLSVPAWAESAPADILLTADPDWMDQAVGQGWCSPPPASI